MLYMYITISFTFIIFCNGSDSLEYGCGWRGGKYAARHSSCQHTWPNIAGTERFMSGAAT